MQDSAFRVNAKPLSEGMNWGAGVLCRRRAPHLYSEADIVRLMNAAWKLRLFDSFRPLMINEAADI